MQLSRKRVLFVQESMQPPGGGQGVAAWGVQALAPEYAIDILSWHPVETAAINRYYGTMLDPANFRVLGFPAALRRLVDLDPDPYSFQPLAFLARRARSIASHYELVLSFSNETDFGVPGIQYIHYPYMQAKYALVSGRPLLSRHLMDLVNFYLRPWRILSGFRFRSMRQNLTLVNSDWTGERVRTTYNIPTRTVYPPITGHCSSGSWAERESGFVCIGRLSGEKRFQRIIEILARVRARGRPVHLHIVTSMAAEHADRAYATMIRGLVEENAAWVHWHENITRSELDHLIATHRYGIHAMEYEHFGMAVAEMVVGGCLVFVPNSGGQVEIVARTPHLTYDSPEDAVNKIVCVLENAELQASLQALLAGRAEMYSAERYMGELREIVAARLQDASDKHSRAA